MCKQPSITNLGFQVWIGEPQVGSLRLINQNQADKMIKKFMDIFAAHEENVQSF